MGRILVSILLGVCCLSGMGCGIHIRIGGGAEAPKGEELEITEELEAALISNLLEVNSIGYLEGECVAEGHSILGAEQGSDTTTAIRTEPAGRRRASRATAVAAA